jgi:hypothetical protein
LRSQQRSRPGSRRRGAAALLVALVGGLAAGPAATAAPPAPATHGEQLVQAPGKAGAPGETPVPVPEAAGDDRLPVVPLVVGLLVFGGVSALLVRRRIADRAGGGRPGPGRSAAPEPGRLDSN